VDDAEPARTPRRAASPDLPRAAWPEHSRRRSLGRALAAAAASTVAPGSGHLMLSRRRLGAVILGGFVFGAALLVVFAATAPRAQLLETLLSTRVLIAATLICLAVAACWIAVIIHTYLIGRPRRMRTGQRLLGAGTVAALCLVVAAPLGLAAYLANSQRSLLDALFPSAGKDAAAAIGKPRLNIMLVGSDAGPDRTGTRTDTMMVASIDTKTGRTTLFGLPRNIGFARFPPGSPMAQKFPNGFHDKSQPLSGDYLLNAVYAYGHAFPQYAPQGPTDDSGLNLLQSSISYMLGLPVDYQIVVDMAGFAAIIDALGGLTVDVGSERITIGGIGPHGQRIKPQGYIEPGVQQLTGEEALAFARSRTNSSDYVRMGRQRCLIQYVLDQKSPTDLLTNFQAVARATTDSIRTNIPREVLPALVSLAGGSGFTLESIAFDPNLPDPNTDSGRFNTYDPDVPYMRQVVRDAITRPVEPAGAPGAGPAATPSAAPTAEPADDESAAGSGSSASTTSPKRGSSSAGSAGTSSDSESGSRSSALTAQESALPQSLAESCRAA
jgi:LCP family protein required for cell wall assembly